MAQVNGHSHDLPSSTDYVTVPLNYAIPLSNGEEAFYNAFDPMDTNIETESVPSRVYDLRGHEHVPQLDVHGFCFIDAGTSQELAFEDDNKVAEAGIYTAEVEALFKRHTGAKRVKVFDYTIRRQGLGEEGPLKRAPVAKVHVDQSRAAAEKRVRDNCEDADELLAEGKRFALCNLWRPLLEGQPVQDKPLAFADYRSIDDSDFFPSKRIGNQHIGQTLGVKSSPKHRWYYLSDQRHEEAVIIKCYDSKAGVAVLVPHTAFTLPGKPPEGYKPRASIEARALLFF